MIKKKKVVAIVLSSVLGAFALTGAGLSIAAFRPIKGTEAAKILLARERLNENATNFNVKSLEDNGFANRVQLNNYNLSNVKKVAAQNSTPSGTVVQNDDAGTVYKDGDKYYFTNTSGASGKGEALLSRFYGIEENASQTAKLIELIKDRFNVTDKWVKISGNEYLLTVKDNCETLFERNKISGTNDYEIDVCKRITREDAKSVYQMYTVTVKENGEFFLPTYNVYIPGERYEYYFEHNGQGQDYVIADFENGFWNIVQPTLHDITNTIIKDGYAYYNMFTNIPDVAEKPYTISKTGGTIINTALTNTFINYYSNNSFSLDVSNLNGIKWLEVSEENIKNINGYDTNNENSVLVHLENGSVMQPDSTFVNGKVTYSYSDISYYAYAGYGKEKYGAQIGFTCEGNTFSEQLQNFKAFLTEAGITTKFNLDDAITAMNVGSEMFNNLPSYYTWNGYLANSKENIEKGIEVLHNTWASFYGEYLEIKNNESTSSWLSGHVAKNRTFADVINFTNGENSYNSGVVTIKDASIKVEESNLLENGNNYTLKIGLAQLDKNGNYSSEHTVGLTSIESENIVKYDGGDITLTQSGAYNIPLVLEEGKYVIVAYCATAEEGIRVSQMQPVAFINTANETLESVAMEVKVESTIENYINVTFTPKLLFTATIKDIKASYSYQDIYNTLMAEALSYGYPKPSEGVLTSAGEAVSTTGTFTEGSFKLKFYVNTAEGISEAYVTITLTTATE